MQQAGFGAAATHRHLELPHHELLIVHRQRPPDDKARVQENKRRFRLISPDLSITSHRGGQPISVGSDQTPSPKTPTIHPWTTRMRLFFLGAYA
jgi:hypothetical protein